MKGTELSTMIGSAAALKVLVAPEPYWDCGRRALDWESWELAGGWVLKAVLTGWGGLL